MKIDFYLYFNQIQVSFIMCNIRFLLSIIDVRDIIFSITAQKIVTWLIYIIIIFVLILINYITDVFRYIVIAMKRNNIPLAIFLYSLEPLMMIFTLINTRYTKTNIDVESNIHIDRFMNRNVAIIIACHNSRDVIGKSVTSCLQHVNPEQIFVIDNGNTKDPSDDTRDVVNSVNQNINYIYYGLRGNKTIAGYIGCRLATLKGLTYALMLDDDVLLPKTFSIPTHDIGGNIVGVCYPITAIGPTNEPNILIEYQAIEYRLADYYNRMVNQYFGVQYPHGAISLWKIDIIEQIYMKHDTVFHAEDMKLGLIAQKMGKRLILADCEVQTIAPDTVFGVMPNLYTQRVRCWSMAPHIYIPKLLYAFIMFWPRTLSGILALKITQYYTLHLIFVDWTRLPVMIILGDKWFFWAMYAFFTVVYTLMILIWNSFRANTSGFHNNVSVILTFFVYRLLQSILSTISVLFAYLVYLPNTKYAKTIPEMIKLGELSDEIILNLTL